MLLLLSKGRRWGASCEGAAAVAAGRSDDVLLCCVAVACWMCVRQKQIGGSMLCPCLMCECVRQRPGEDLAQRPSRCVVTHTHRRQAFSECAMRSLAPIGGRATENPLVVTPIVPCVSRRGRALMVFPTAALAGASGLHVVHFTGEHARACKPGRQPLDTRPHPHPHPRPRSTFKSWKRPLSCGVTQRVPPARRAPWRRQQWTETARHVSGVCSLHGRGFTTSRW